MPKGRKSGQGEKRGRRNPAGDLARKLRQAMPATTSGIPISTDSCVVVQRVSGPATTAGTALRTAYDQAKRLRGVAQRVVTVLIPPGIYDFGTGGTTRTGLVLDDHWIELVGLGGDPSEVIIKSAVSLDNTGTLVVATDAVVLRNLTVSWTAPAGFSRNNTKADPAALFIREHIVNATNLSYTVNAERVRFLGLCPMRTNIEIRGSFVDCEGGNYCFGSLYGSEASADFVRCVGGQGCFAGYGGTASGKFVDCVSNVHSFGGGGGHATGVFQRCESLGINCFGGQTMTPVAGTMTGKMYDCIVKGPLWGTVTGLLQRCRVDATTLGTEAEPWIPTYGIKVGTGAKIYECTVLTSGTSPALKGPGSVTAVHSRFNVAADADVTNYIGTPYNIVDTHF